VGVSANRVDVQGRPIFKDMVVFARGIVNTRKQITMTGTDPYYVKSDFYPCVGSLTEAAGQCFDAGSANDAGMPASIHSTDRIFLDPNGRNIHPPNPNCTMAQYIWDGSATGSNYAADGVAAAAGCPSYPNRPPTTLFTDADADRLTETPRLTEEDHHYYKNVAQTSGLYCSNYGTNAASCVRAGSTANVSGAIDNGDVAGLGNFMVVYIEFPDGTNPLANSLSWNVTDPAPTPMTTCNSTAPPDTSVLVIVRNGGFGLSRGNGEFVGAVFAEDGRIDIKGQQRIEAAMATQYLWVRGQSVVCNSQRWVDSLPGAFISVLPLQWSEVDR